MALPLKEQESWLSRLFFIIGDNTMLNEDVISFTQEELDEAVIELERLSQMQMLHTLFEQGKPFVESVAEHLGCSFHLAGMAMAVGGQIPVISSELHVVYTELYP